MVTKKQFSDKQRIRKLEQKVEKLEKALMQMKNSSDIYAETMFDDHEALLEYFDSLMDALVDKDILNAKAVNRWDKKYEKRMNALYKKVKKA